MIWQRVSLEILSTLEFHLVTKLTTIQKKKKKRVLEASSSIFYNLLSHFLLCIHKFLQKFLNWLFELFALFYR